MRGQKPRFHWVRERGRFGQLPRGGCEWGGEVHSQKGTMQLGKGHHWNLGRTQKVNTGEVI